MPLPNIGPLELIIILVIVLLVMGPGKLPEVGSALGKSIREFRKAANDVQEAAKLDVTPTSPVQPAPTVQPTTVAPIQPAPTAPLQAAPVGEAPVGASETAAAAAEPQPNVLRDAASPNEMTQPRA